MATATATIYSCPSPITMGQRERKTKTTTQGTQIAENGPVFGCKTLNRCNASEKSSELEEPSSPWTVRCGSRRVLRENESFGHKLYERGLGICTLGRRSKRSRTHRLLANCRILSNTIRNQRKLCKATSYSSMRWHNRAFSHRIVPNYTLPCDGSAQSKYSISFPKERVLQFKGAKELVAFLCEGLTSRCWRSDSVMSQSLLRAFILFTVLLVAGAVSSQYGDAEHITAILGEAVILNCPVSQPDTPYIIQWKRQHYKIPIYIWYDGYDPHVEEAYKGRASRVNSDTTLGLASLNLTSVKEDDQGWYECKVFYLDRTGATDNGTWVHLDVHAPPRFTTTPDDVTYVNIGDSIILNCEAEGTPKPEIFWFRDDESVTPSDSVGIFNDGTELRINKIRDQDIGDYLCVARNAEGRVYHAAKVVIAGGAVIITPPFNITLHEGAKAEFPCEAKALPGNVTVMWKRENVAINKLSWLDTRSIVRRDGTLVINPTSADDGGFFTCEVSNGIGTPQTATAYLNVEYPARVTFTPTLQYLPFRQQGIIKCFVKANPEAQFVTWIKDKRLFQTDEDNNVVKLKNGSLLITKVNQSYQGRYSCTPYNKHATAGSSGDMEVLVREPPVFAPRPQTQYYGQVGEEVTLVCGGSGTLNPTVTWRRRDANPIPRDRTEIVGGNLTIKSLRKDDHGYFECEVKNEILAIVASTQLLVEGTTPHPPYNITTSTTPFSVQLSWLPGYPGGRDFQQKYTIWYRTLGANTWSQIDVKPASSTTVKIHNLTPGTTYEFQVQGKNELGDGMFSEIVSAKTEGEAPSDGIPNQDHDSANASPKPSNAEPSNVSEPKAKYDYHGLLIYPTDSTGSTYFPTIINSKGPKPPPPRNVTVRKVLGGHIISWEKPSGSLPIANYEIEIQASGESWKKLNKENIVNETSYTARKLTPGKKFKLRVIARTLTSFQASEEIVYEVDGLDKEKAVTAALVGGLLLCIVAIILSVCTIKICNKRKRKQQEKAYNMVAYRVNETKDPGHSPVPLKKLLRAGVSGVRRIRIWLASILLGTDLFDTTDSRPLGSALTSYDSDTFRSLRKSRGHSGRRRFSSIDKHKLSPLPEIARTDEGKFILDKDSDEGGFTSPRRPARGVRGGRVWSEFPESGWTTAVGGIESGVYHVKRGKATHHSGPALPRLSLLSEGSGASTYELPRNTYLSPNAYENFIVTTKPFGGMFFTTPVVQSSPFGSPGIRHFSAGPLVTPRRKPRYSSPHPLSPPWQQVADINAFGEFSSVKQPSSAERSFPSTVLSSFHNTPLQASSHDGQIFFSSERSPYLSGEHFADTVDFRHPSGRFHVVGAQVHEPPHYRSRLAYHPYYLPPPTYHPHPHKVYHPNFGWFIPETNVLGSGQHLHHIPSRNEKFHLFHPSFSRAAARRYVNVPPLGHRVYGERPYRKEHLMLLKTSPVAARQESQKPLATSSPPRVRIRSIEGGASQSRGGQQFPRSLVTGIHPRYPHDYVVRKPFGKTPYTAQKFDASHKHKISGRIRHHSAPSLSSVKSDSISRDTKFIQPSTGAHKSGRKVRSHNVSYEFSQDQSPDSSGFGSKNTSQHQSSSQSGQSSSALGLDVTRLSDSSLKYLKLSEETFDESRPVLSEHLIWPPPRLPPSYEDWLARQIQPQFRDFALTYGQLPSIDKNVVSFTSPSGAKSSAMSRTNERTVHTHSSLDELENEVIDSVDSVGKPFTSGGRRAAATLDVSVDDQYEFDAMLSPTPVDDTLGASGSGWSYSSEFNTRCLSDSDLHGSSTDARPCSHESMEERVAAMKQEFLAYRRRQALRKENQLESNC